jgi:hypothetical protein
LNDTADNTNGKSPPTVEELLTDAVDILAHLVRGDDVDPHQDDHELDHSWRYAWHVSWQPFVSKLATSPLDQRQAVLHQELDGWPPLNAVWLRGLVEHRLKAWSREEAARSNGVVSSDGATRPEEGGDYVATEAHGGQETVEVPSKGEDVSANDTSPNEQETGTATNFATPAIQALSWLRQWVVWKLVWRKRSDGTNETTKPPYTQNWRSASTIDPATWTTFSEAMRAVPNPGHDRGVGFVFTSDDPYTGVDIDGCRDPRTGLIADWARLIVEELDSYTEVSPSGTGVKILIEGALPVDGAKKDLGDTVEKISDKNPAIEAYSARRYFTITGQHLAGTPEEIKPSKKGLGAFYERCFGSPNGTPNGDATTSEHTWPSPGLDDDELLEIAFGASNGDRIRALFESGDIFEYANDDSRADQALACFLAFYTGSDTEQLWRLIKRSMLYRDKWERADYRERTFRKALDGLKDVYHRPGAHMGSESRRNGSGAEPGAVTGATTDWSPPSRIDGPASAPVLPLACFPPVLVEHAADIAERMQCAIDYVVWTLMVTVATVIGREVGIRPKRWDDWTERLAFWVALLGDPSSMKTPGMNAGVRLLHRLNHELREQYRRAMEAWRADCAVARQADPKHPDLPPEPELRWLVADDATTEKLAMMLQPEISRGLVLARDEVAGLILELERYRQRAGDRQFLLQAYTGGPKSVARVTREPVFVPDLLLNIVGGIQPDMARDVFGSGVDDGLGERFLAIWPAQSTDFLDVDRLPDKSKRDLFDEVARWLYAANWRTLLITDEFSPVPYCRVSEDAYTVFSEWRARTLLSTRGESPRYEGRFGHRVGKYPGLAARIALVLHLFEQAPLSPRLGVGNRRAPVSAGADIKIVEHELMQRVVTIMDRYVLPMEERVYGTYNIAPEAAGSRRIARWIREEKPERFTAREIRRHEWAGLDDSQKVASALEWLCSRDWLREADP